MSPTRKRGRPGVRGSMVVSVRIPVVVYDAYIRRAARADRHIRTELRMTLTANAARAGLTAKEARAQAVALLLLADEMERKGDERAAPFRSPKFAAIPA